MLVSPAYAFSTPGGMPQMPAAASSDSRTQPGPANQNLRTSAENQVQNDQAEPASAASASNKKPAELSVITVTGQVAALRRAQATKRNALGVVDSISAEEAGKFPDQNVADALQRVPGVSVNRADGEANHISVRGFGPEFVTVLLNGRTMASASTDRAFNFNVLASGVIKQAIVHKTSSADMQAGGIGGTVNIITAKPFDFDGFHLSASATAVNDNIGGGFSDETTPKVSMLIGDSNKDRTFGWLASVIYYKRDHTEQAAATTGWITGLDYSYINPAYTDIAIPQQLTARVLKQERTRKTFNGAIEWQPNQNLTINVNLLYSEFKVDSKYNAFGSYTNVSDIKSLIADENGTALKFTRFDTGVLSNDYIIESDPVYAHNEQTGAHIRYQLSDSWQMNFDTSVSRAWNKQSKNSYFLVIGTRNVGVNPVWTNNGNNHLPSYDNLISTTDTSDLRAHCCHRGAESPNVTDEISENKLSFTKTFLYGALAKLDFGIESSDRKKRQITWVTPNNLFCGEYCGYTAKVPAEAVGAHVFRAGTLVGGVSPGFPTKWITYDADKYFAYLASPAAYNQLPNAEDFKKRLEENGGTFAARANPRSLSVIKERVKAAYIQAKFQGMMGSMPWALSAGVRYTKTQTTSIANSVPLLAITVNPNDTSNALPTYGDITPISAEGSYANWLPSAAFKLHLLDDLIFRLAGSKTLTRPDIANLSAARVYNFRPQNQTESTGNVDLKPYTSTNWDTGLEWYINDASYISLDAFYKKVENFVTLVTVPEEILGFTFQKTFPVNLNSATIKGAEFTFNYQFNKLPYPFNGLGLATNYTYVTSSASLNPSIIATQGKFAVPGIGDSANASIYFSQGPIQLRLADNWRSSYLQSISGNQSQPTSVKAYNQIDFSSSYAINKHFTVYFDMTNLTNEKIYRYQVYLNRESYAEANGRTAYLGVRAKW